MATAVTRVKPPYFRVGRFKLNEYELRTLQLEVAQGLKPIGTKVKDCLGMEATIGEHGSLSHDLHGMSMAIDIKFQLLRLRNPHLK